MLSWASVLGAAVEGRERCGWLGPQSNGHGSRKEGKRGEGRGKDVCSDVMGRKRRWVCRSQGARRGAARRCSPCQLRGPSAGHHLKAIVPERGCRSRGAAARCRGGGWPPHRRLSMSVLVGRCWCAPIAAVAAAGSRHCCRRRHKQVGRWGVLSCRGALSSQRSRGPSACRPSCRTQCRPRPPHSGPCCTTGAIGKGVGPGVSRGRWMASDVDGERHESLRSTRSAADRLPLSATCTFISPLASISKPSAHPKERTRGSMRWVGNQPGLGSGSR